MTLKYQKILDDLDAQFMGKAEKIGLTADQFKFLESLRMRKQKVLFTSFFIK